MKTTWIYVIRARAATGHEDIITSTRGKAQEAIDRLGAENYYDTMTIVEVEYTNIADLVTIGYEGYRKGPKSMGKPLAVERINK